MITFARDDSRPSPPAWHAGFLALLPRIRKYLRIGFRRLPADERDEAMADAVANTAVAYARLHERNKLDVAFAASLADYAIKQYFSGRRVGGKLNTKDVSSPYAQRVRGFFLNSLDQRTPSGEWMETLVEDKNCGPAEIAAVRLDVADWLADLPPLKRSIAETLATGEGTTATAKKFGVVPGRVSQVRNELAESWSDYQGESLAWI